LNCGGGSEKENEEPDRGKLRKEVTQNCATIENASGGLGQKMGGGAVSTGGTKEKTETQKDVNAKTQYSNGKNTVSVAPQPRSLTYFQSVACDGRISGVVHGKKKIHDKG